MTRDQNIGHGAMFPACRGFCDELRKRPRLADAVDSSWSAAAPEALPFFAAGPSRSRVSRAKVNADLEFRRVPFWWCVGNRTDGHGDASFAVMSMLKKPDPELLPSNRPPCPQCGMRMITVPLSSGPDGFEHRTFECPKCVHIETTIVACDPMKSNAAGWIAW
jgi:hypothetical protein